MFALGALRQMPRPTERPRVDLIGVALLARLAVQPDPRPPGGTRLGMGVGGEHRLVRGRAGGRDRAGRVRAADRRAAAAPAAAAPAAAAGRARRDLREHPLPDRADLLLQPLRAGGCDARLLRRHRQPRAAPLRVPDVRRLPAGGPGRRPLRVPLAGRRGAGADGHRGSAAERRRRATPTTATSGGCSRSSGWGSGPPSRRPPRRGCKALPTENAGEASGIINVVRYVSAALVISLGTILFVQVGLGRPQPGPERVRGPHISRRIGSTRC